MSDCQKCSIILHVLSWGPSLSGPCFLGFFVSGQMPDVCAYASKNQILILCISESSSGLPLTGGVMLDSFLPYINNRVKVLPLHRVLPGVTGGGLGSLRDMECLASPHAKARDRILQGIQKASGQRCQINQQLPWGEGVDISPIP